MKYIYLSIIVVFLDQTTKIYIKNYWIENNLFYKNINIISNYLRFTFLENPGIAFGIDTGGYHFMITLLTILAIGVLLFHFYNLIKTNDKETLPISLIVGGAIGNGIDRILMLIPSLNYNGVVDFIDIGFNNYRWYVFNIADTSITIGLIIMFLQFFMSKKTIVK